MSKAKVLKKYPNAHIAMIEGRVPMVSTGKRYISQGRTKTEAWANALETIQREEDITHDAKETIIDGILSSLRDYSEALTWDDMKELLDEAKERIESYPELTRKSKED